MEVLRENFQNVNLPLTLLSQYLPKQYDKVRNGELANEAWALVRDVIGAYIDDYYYAILR